MTVNCFCHYKKQHKQDFQTITFLDVFYLKKENCRLHTFIEIDHSFVCGQMSGTTTFLLFITFKDVAL